MHFGTDLPKRFRRRAQRHPRAVTAIALLVIGLLAGGIQVRHAPTAHASTCSLPCSYGWSGYLVYADTFDDVQGHWNVQPAYAVSLYSGLGTWVGIGGEFGSGNLAQTGTAWSNGHYHPFYEFYPDPPVINVNVNLVQGTAMDAEVYKSGTRWCTTLIWSTGEMDGCSYSGFAANQASAEWIDERPAGCDTLLNFDFTNFSNGYAHSITRGWHTIGGFPRYQMYSIDQGSGKRMAWADSLNTPGTTSFTDHFQYTGTMPTLC